MTKTPSTFPNPEITTIVLDTCFESTKTDMEITYPGKKTIDETICKKLMNMDSYKIDMHKIYNLIVGQTNEQLQDKASLQATFQAVKTVRYTIGYLMILNKLCSSNQSEQHPIHSL